MVHIPGGRGPSLESGDRRGRRSRPRGRGGTLGALGMAWALAAAPLFGCVGEGRAQIPLEVTAASADGAAFEVSGAQVELTTAAIGLADLRWQEPPLGAARVHPGHDYDGDVAGELLGSWSVDLLADAEPLGVATCYEGRLSTGSLSIAGEPLAAHLAGRLTPPGMASLPFDFQIALDAEVHGIPFEVEIDGDAPPQGILLTLSPAQMLSFADLAAGDTDGSGALDLADGALANSVPFGVVSTTAFTFTLTP